MNEALARKLDSLHPKRRALYAGLANLDQEECLFANALTVGSRLNLPKDVLDHLFERRRSISTDRVEWDEHVRFAMALDVIMLDLFLETPLDRFDGLIDHQANGVVVEHLKCASGMLLLTFHGGFRMMFLRLFDELFNNGVMIRRGGSGVRAGKDRRGGRGNIHISGMNNPREALFVAMRALLEGRQVLMAPDGPFGKQKTTIRVLDAECPVATGAAFLAYETKCSTAWFSIVRGDRGFAPFAVLGPRREDGETFEGFQGRLNQFYAEMIASAFTGDPRNLTLSGRWLQNFRAKLADRKG